MDFHALFTVAAIALYFKLLIAGLAGWLAWGCFDRATKMNRLATSMDVRLAFFGLWIVAVACIGAVLEPQWDPGIGSLILLAALLLAMNIVQHVTGRRWRHAAPGFFDQQTDRGPEHPKWVTPLAAVSRDAEENDYYVEPGRQIGR